MRHSSLMTRFKVGFFTIVGILSVILIAIFVNKKPFWWRSCQLVYVHIEDATGLRTKSTVRSLGIDIGYLNLVHLEKTGVLLGICLSAPVELLPDTRAYLRSEGFLGDKFLEIKPVRYLFDKEDQKHPFRSLESQKVLHLEKPSSSLRRFLDALWIPSAYADEVVANREILVGDGAGQDVQGLIVHMNGMVKQLSEFTNNLNQAIRPVEIRNTLQQMNQLLQRASHTLAPGGSLTSTAQRSLVKLEDAIEQLRDIMARVNRGEGTVGKLINDPSYAEDIKKLLTSVNRLLNRVELVRFHLDLGAMSFDHLGSRSWFEMGIWPRADRYYLLGVAFDPRATLATSVTTTTIGDSTQVVKTQTMSQNQLKLSLMLGKVLKTRYDFSVGVLYGDGTGSFRWRLGPAGNEDLFQIRSDLYVRSAKSVLDDRISFTVMPLPYFYCRIALESMRKDPETQKMLFLFGAGLSIDDEDIKLLFALK